MRRLSEIDRNQFKPIKERRGRTEWSERPLKYFLYKNRNDNTYWEARPLFTEEDIYYSGGPMEYVEVTQDYAKEHYPEAFV
jgi:hypothetical protein